MKKLLSITLFATILCNTTFAQGWKTIDIVDDFGDKVGERIAFIGDGTFSNSATTNSEMFARITIKPYKIENELHLVSLESYTKYYDEISKDWKPSTRAFAMKPNRLKSSFEKEKEKSKNKIGTLTFEFFEYKDNPATFMRKYDSTTLRIKLEDGSTINYFESENEYANTSQLWSIVATKGTDSENIWNAITDDKPIRCVVLHRNSKYLFSVDGYNLN